jgi:hypothetical protein
MEDQSSVQTYYSSRRALQWYQWLFVLFTFAWAVGSVYLIYWSFEIGTRETKMIVPAIMAVAIFWRIALPMLTEQVIVRADEKSLLEVNTPRANSIQPILFTDISQGLRRSETCLELQLKSKVMVTYQYLPLPDQRYVNEFMLTSTQQELDRLCHQLSGEGVAIVADPIPDDDPQKNIVMLILVCAGTFLLIAGMIALVFKLTNAHL